MLCWQPLEWLFWLYKVNEQGEIVPLHGHPQVLCHCFWRGLFCFPVKPCLRTVHWEIKNRSCMWPVATKEVPCPCCHQQLLLHHNLTSFLGSSLTLPKFWWSCLRTVTANHRPKGPCYILPVSCSPDNIVPAYLARWWEIFPPSLLLGSRASIPPTLSC